MAVGAVRKKELVELIAKTSESKNKDVKRFLDSFINVVKNQLKIGNQVYLAGFGKFFVTQRAARIGRNPRTGQKLQISAKKSPLFRAGSQFKKAVE